MQYININVEICFVFLQTTAEKREKRVSYNHRGFDHLHFVAKTRIRLFFLNITRWAQPLENSWYHFRIEIEIEIEILNV